jgi:hypothetical protein
MTEKNLKQWAGKKVLGSIFSGVSQSVSRFRHSEDYNLTVDHLI